MLSAYSFYDMIKASLYGSSLQKEMGGAFKYGSQWGKLQDIYNHLNEDPFEELQMKETPQIDPLFPPLHQVFFDEASAKSIAANDNS